MWLTVEHVTRFAYDAPINEAYTEIRLKPSHRDGQRCSSFVLTTEPRGATVEEYHDRFGNTIHHFDVLEAHDRISVTVRSEVWTPSRLEPDEPTPSLLDHWDFLQPTRYVSLDGEIAELAASVPGLDGPLETATELVAAVQGAITYERGSTHVHTTADEALSEGSGVCQDFAHVFIGACRARGIPARYVSGYLYDQPAGDHASESHAWVDVLDEDRGWIALDPTHGREQDERYVRVGVGRDYADVPPSRGVYKGQATEQLEVSVTITAP
jgi:transglutaminase-like putative cysteine protease